MGRIHSRRVVVRLVSTVLGIGSVMGLADQAAAKPPVLQPDQQAHMQQFARQIESQFQPFVQAQLELARSTCGSLPVAVRRQVAAAAGKPLRGIADEIAARQFGQRPDEAQRRADPLAPIHEALAAALEPHVPAAELAAFRREHAAAIARRGRAARMQIVAKLDQRLMLSAAQRTAIEADLEKQWQPGWFVELNDTGHHNINGGPPAADFADRCIAPHLDDRQRAAWKAWSQSSGWKQFGQSGMDALHMINTNIMHTQFPRDPWWAP